MWNCTHRKRIFRKTIFRPLRGDAPPNFYNALENDQFLLAHPPPGTRALLSTFFKEESKIGLKCSVLDDILLEPKGVAS